MTEDKDHQFLAAQKLHQLLPRLDRLMRQIDREAGATGAQLSALAAVSELGKDRLHLLAAHEGVSRPTMSRIVSALTEKGWLESITDPRDGRTPVLSVSQAGRKVLERCCAKRTDALMRTLDGLDRPTSQAFAKALGLVAASMK